MYACMYDMVWYGMKWNGMECNVCMHITYLPHTLVFGVINGYKST